MSRDLWGLSTTGHVHPRFGVLSWVMITYAQWSSKGIDWRTVSLELIRRKDERWQHRQHKQDPWSDSVLLFVLDVVKPAVIQQQFWMKECDIFRGQNILWPVLHISGGHDPPTPGSTPLENKPVPPSEIGSIIMNFQK